MIKNAMLEKTVAYVREFLGDPKNHDLLNHFESEVRNAKYEGRTEGIEENKIETAKKMLLKGIDLKLTAEITGLNEEDLHKLSIV